MKFLSIISLITVIFISGCTAAGTLIDKKPEFRFRNAEFNGIQDANLSLTVFTDLVNPWPFTLPAGTLNTDIALEKTKLTSLKIPFKEVRGGGSIPVSFEITVPLSSLLKAASSSPAAEFLNLEAEGSAELKILPDAQSLSGNLSSVQIPFYHKEEVPSFFPVIDISSLTLQRPSIGTSGDIKAAAVISVKNSGMAKFIIDNPSVRLYIEDRPFVLTNALSVTSLGSENRISAEASLPLSSAGTALISAMARQKASWKADITSGIIFIRNNQPMKPVRFSGIRNGTVNISQLN